MSYSFIIQVLIGFQVSRKNIFNSPNKKIIPRPQAKISALKEAGAELSVCVTLLKYSESDKGFA